MNSNKRCGDGLAGRDNGRGGRRLGNVVAFLAQKSLEAAERLGLELVALIFSLDQMPSRGAPVKSRPGLREIAHRPYLVIYHVNEAQSLVEIIRVWDGRQDPSKLTLR